MTSPARLSNRLLCLALLLTVAGTVGCRRTKGTISVPANETFVQVSNGAEIEPNDQSASPHYLGVLRQGEMMTVTGHAQAGDPAVDPFADEFDGFAISLAQPSEIEFILTFDDSAGELDTWIYDPAIDDIAIFFESDFSPESGFFYVYAPVLDFHIVVRALFGQANYTLDIYARPIPLFASTSELAELPTANDQALALANADSFGPSLEIAEDNASRAKTGLRPETSARAESRRRYLGQSALESIDELPAFQTGVLLIFDPSGSVLSAPIMAVAPGVRELLLE